MAEEVDDWMIDAEGVPSPSFYYFPPSTTPSCLDDIHQVSDGLERLVVCLQAQVLSALRVVIVSLGYCDYRGECAGRLVRTKSPS